MTRVSYRAQEWFLIDTQLLVRARGGIAIADLARGKVDKLVEIEEND